MMFKFSSDEDAGVSTLIEEEKEETEEETSKEKATTGTKETPGSSSVLDKL